VDAGDKARQRKRIALELVQERVAALSPRRHQIEEDLVEVTGDFGF
jgi:hypothetical protein